VATYKLIQNIEAEDKILGPFTLRQFIFAMIAIFLFYICFILVVKNVAFLLVLFLPPALFFGFFALPFGRDQPTEVWALAKVRFWFKPRRRVWNQSGVKELVTITVPKKVERILTNGLSQTEVKSRLQALADTIDSRGWATKHAGSETYSPQPIAGANPDRLIDIASLPQEVPSDGLVAADDMMDEISNPIARQFDAMINQSSQARRQQMVDLVNDTQEDRGAGLAGAPVANNWFMPQAPAMAMPAPAMYAAPAPTVPADPAAEAALSASLAARANSGQVSFGNLRTVQPLSGQAGPVVAPVGADPASSLPADTQTAVTAPSDPAILSLAKNDDFNVATLARQARKNRDDGSQPRSEVVVSLR
jgi:hypothetical protein